MCATPPKVFTVLRAAHRDRVNRHLPGRMTILTHPRPKIEIFLLKPLFLI